MTSSKLSISRSVRNSDLERAPEFLRRPASIATSGLAALLLGLTFSGAPIAAQAQSAPPNQFGAQTLPRSPILTVDSERMFSESKYGEKLAAQIEAQASEIAAENRRLEAELAEEERQLTEKRRQMNPDDFKALADAFDEKVTRIRKEREERAKDLGQDSDDVRRKFLISAEPVLDQIMREAGAAVILERRSVFVARDVVDITDEAVARIDAALLDSVDDDGQPDGTGTDPDGASDAVAGAGAAQADENGADDGAAPATTDGAATDGASTDGSEGQ